VQGIQIAVCREFPYGHTGSFGTEEKYYEHKNYIPKAVGMGNHVAGVSVRTRLYYVAIRFIINQEWRRIPILLLWAYGNKKGRKDLEQPSIPMDVVHIQSIEYKEHPACCRVLFLLSDISLHQGRSFGLLEGHPVAGNVPVGLSHQVLYASKTLGRVLDAVKNHVIADTSPVLVYLVVQVFQVAAEGHLGTF
jgi:hypothetical protein